MYQEEIVEISAIIQKWSIEKPIALWKEIKGKLIILQMQIISQLSVPKQLFLETQNTQETMEKATRLQ